MTILQNDSGETIVVDNGSTDGSVEMVQREFPSVRVITCENRGYGAALNEALARSTCSYLVALNSDTLLKYETISILSRFLDSNPAVAVAGPRLLNPDGTLQRSCRRFPGTASWLIDNRLIGRWFGTIPTLRNKLFYRWPHDTERSVPFVVGAAFIARVDALKSIGGFDESFFMYFEEADLCYRMRQAGWDVRFTPNTEVIHIGGESTVQVRDTMLEVFVQSSLHFYTLHYSGLQLKFSRALLKCMLTFRLVRDAVLSRIARTPETRSRASENVPVWWRCITGQSRQLSVSLRRID